jgi:hypothetical protein
MNYVHINVPHLSGGENSLFCMFSPRKVIFLEIRGLTGLYLLHMFRI